MLASSTFYFIILFLILKFFLTPKNKHSHALVFLFCVKIKGMDKIIKTISENGSFRAYVLDSTETVRTAQEKHQTQASSTVALGRTLIASQILAANEKGDTKITVKSSWNELSRCHHHCRRYQGQCQRLCAKSRCRYQKKLQRVKS